MNLEQQRAIAIASARMRAAQQPEPELDPATDPDYDPYTAANILGSAVEPMMTMGSGALGASVGGLMGLGTLATGGDSEEATKRIGEVAEALTYKPRTGGGQIATEAITYPFRKLAEGTEYVGGKVSETIPHPETGAGVGAAIKTGLDIIPMIAGAKMIKGEPHFPKAEAAIKKVVKAPAKAVGKVLHFAKEGISHRLPGGHERAIGDTLYEMIGPERAPKVIDALMKAKKGETVGQAASRTGSYELSALQKMAESRDPSGYGDIARAQQHARLKSLKTIGKTPKELATAEALMKKHAAEGYGKVRADYVDPRSTREMLIDAATKAKEKATTAGVSKGEALRDWGRFKTLEEQQATRALRRPPEVGPLAERLTGQKTPTSRQMGDIYDKSRLPARYTPQRAVSKEAGKAATEASKIAKQRATTEQAMTDVSETMLLNTLGEKGTSFGKYISRPSVKKAIVAARKSANETGSYFPKESGDKFTVANLQRIKRAIAENMSKEQAQGSLGATEQAEIAGTLGDFTKWLRGKSKGFAKAEDMYAQEVKYVNRMKVGQALTDKLKPKLGAKDRATQFANAVDDVGNLVKSETGRKMPLNEILKSKQMSTVRRVKAELDRDVRMGEQATKGMQRMNEAVGTIHDIPKVTILERSIVIFNAILKRIEGRNTKVTLDLLAQKLKNPAETARIIKAALPEEAAFIKQIDPEVMAMIVGSEEAKQ